MEYRGRKAEDGMKRAMGGKQKTIYVVEVEVATRQVLTVLCRLSSVL